MSFQECHLWKRSFRVDQGDRLADTLRTSLLKIRTQVVHLVGEIAGDLKEFTVHDITHLDALWELANEIAGPQFEMNPAEAFVFGGAILLHDAGMSSAAYIGGVPEIKTQPSWPYALAKFAHDPAQPTENEIRLAVLEVIRQDHASKAATLASTEWRTSDGQIQMLIEEGDLRQKFAMFIGQVAASHWWSYDKIRRDLDRIIPCPPPYPVLWRIDLLKLASLLRVSDAAHIDQRRAPSFLWALRAHSLGRQSVNHWAFQNRITQPERRADALHFASTVDFEKSEAEAWWFAYDALNVVSRELRSADGMLADLRGENARFAARRVAGIESPESLTRAITVHGWTPVNAKLHVSNVKKLVETLGGSALYGENPYVVVRELVQNAVDAIELRKAVDSSFSDRDVEIVIKIDNEDGKVVLSVYDNGIGMDAETLTETLLDFGSSGWTKDRVITESSGLSTSERRSLGKFGIGFFSVFMIGKKIDIHTRRYDRAHSDTLSFSFSDGLESRPILSNAERQDWISSGGTLVSVELANEQAIRHFLEDDFAGRCGMLFPTISVRIKVDCQGVVSLIDATSWDTEEAVIFLSRLYGVRILSETQRLIASLLLPVYDHNGVVAGRMAVLPESRFFEREKTDGSIVCKGFSVSDMRLSGAIEGMIATADRGSAVPLLPKLKVSEWCAEYEEKAVSRFDHEEQAEIAEILWSLGYTPTRLKIFEISSGWLDLKEFSHFLSEQKQIFVVQDAAWSNFLRNRPGARLNDDVVAVSMGHPALFNRERHMGYYHSPENIGKSLEMLLKDILIAEFGIIESIFSFYDGGIDDKSKQLLYPFADYNGKIYNYRGELFRRNMSVEDIITFFNDPATMGNDVYV